MKPNDLNELKELKQKRSFVDKIVSKIKTRLKMREGLKHGVIAGLISAAVCGLITLALPSNLMFIGLIFVGLTSGAALGCGVARVCMPAKDDKEKAALLETFPEEAKVIEGAEANLQFDINARDCARFINGELDKKIIKLERNIPYGKLQGEKVSFDYNDRFRDKVKTNKSIYKNVEMSSCRGRTVEQNNTSSKDDEKEDMDR